MRRIKKNDRSDFKYSMLINKYHININKIE